MIIKKIILLKFFSFSKIAIVVIALLLSINSNIYAQSTSYREQRPHGIHFQLFGPTVLGLHYDYHLSNTYDIDLGIGIGLDIQFGVKFHPFGNETSGKISPYLGLFISRIRQFHPGLFGGSSGFGPESTLGLYLPVGIEIYTDKAFTFSIEGAYNYTSEDWGQANTRDFYFALRTGFHY